MKTFDSRLTSINTEFKGYFNDPALVTEGFEKYDILHEIYAITKLLFFIMTGKTNTSDISDERISAFVKKGLNPDKSHRYQDVNQISKAFRSCWT